MIGLRRLATVLALLVVAATGTAAAAGGVGPLTDPSSGANVEVRPGALLHLVFFATWCPPCLDEFPGLADLEARWQDDGYELVLIAVPTRHTPERLREFVAERRPPGRVLLDSTGKVTADLAVRDVPTHILLDSTGREIARTGSLDDEIVARIREVLRR